MHEVTGSGDGVGARLDRQVGLIVGCKVRSLRISRGLCQEGVANSIGVSSATVSLWERGARPVSLVHLIRLASYFGVDPAVLLPSPEELNRPEESQGATSAEP